MQVRVSTDRDQWNRFVEAAATGYITQTYEWGDLSAHLGDAIVRLGAFDGDELRGAMIVLVSRMPPLGLRYLYVPRGPVVDDPASPALPALLAEARRLARRTGAFMLKVEPNVPAGDPAWLGALARLGFRRNPYATHPRRSWVVDVTPSEQQLLANMKMTWRYNVRAAARKGVVVREATAAADLAAWYRLYQETAQRDGFAIHPQDHYANVLELYRARGAGVQFLAEYNGTPIAGLIVCRCGAVATSMFSASSNQHRDRRPNHLLQWTGMRWAKSHGCALYDFRAIAERLEPTEPDYSLYTYKEGFGGYSVLTLEGHDLPYNLPLYWAYRQSLAFKRARVRRRFAQRVQERTATTAGTATDAAKSAAAQETIAEGASGTAASPTGSGTTD
ncbi:MAG TPA: peptidoglycan bridge formation glycyltransferase FemA/FemB family protein [Ktedonobacterales bacterium]|nr:peptidoglycan bridge formation glycyltransferase FemA/FemB family protein [Ktedonobacterales bacterium]